MSMLAYCNCYFSGIASARTHRLAYVVQCKKRSGCSSLSLGNGQCHCYMANSKFFYTIQ
jgi:hypothetical protein